MLNELAIKILLGLHTLHTPAICDSPQNYCYPINTDNKLIAIQVDHVILGRMINSYNRESFIFGLANNWEYNNFSVNYGIIAATNYPGNSLGLKSGTIKLDESKILPAPYLGISYSLTSMFSAEATFQGTALNLGVSVNF